MKVFAIHDDEIDIKNSIGYLFHYERSNSFVIELVNTLDEWNAPLLFSTLVKRGVYTIPKDIAMLWVQERVIPSGRQNIGLILKNSKMAKYSEGKLLALSQGKSSQDACYVKKIDVKDLPDWVIQRQKSNIFEAFPIVDNRIVCLQNNDYAIAVDLEKCLDQVPKLYTVLSDERLMSTLKVEAGGYGVCFNDSISVDKDTLINNGVVLPIYARVFTDFANHSVINTTEACTILNCSRQNLAYFIKNKILHPIKESWKENVFLRGELTSMD